MKVGCWFRMLKQAMMWGFLMVYNKRIFQTINGVRVIAIYSVFQHDLTQKGVHGINSINIYIYIATWPSRMVKLFFDSPKKLWKERSPREIYVSAFIFVHYVFLKVLFSVHVACSFQGQSSFWAMINVALCSNDLMTFIPPWNLVECDE